VSAQPLGHFLALLKRSPHGAVFNPWWQRDEENDIGPRASRMSERRVLEKGREKIARNTAFRQVN
jgi:hypothetical protein